MDSAFLASTVMVVMMALIGVVIFAYINQNNSLTERCLRSQADLKCKQLEADVQAANKRIADLEQRLEAAHAHDVDLERRLEAARQRNIALRAQFEKVYLESERKRWLGRVQKKTFRSKAEIGARLLYPMLRFLGYTDDAFEVDYPIKLIGGPRGQPVLVSCYVYTVLGGSMFKPRLLLEAIPPDEGITDPTREQVRLKAFSAEVPRFGITDGNSLELYMLADPNKPIVQCRIDDLRANWDNIQAQLGADVP